VFIWPSLVPPVEARSLLTIRAVVLLFPPIDPVVVVVVLPLAFLGYGGLLFAFLCSFFCFGRIVHLKMSSLGEWPSQRVVTGVIFGRFFHLLFFDFGSQIYTSPPTSA